MALTPHLPSINSLYINFAINGYASGGIECISDVWILEMWQQECGPYVQALHFVFGLGSVMTPLVVEPYLSGKEAEDIYSDNYNTTETLVTDYINETETTVIYLPQLAYNQSVVENEELFHSRVYIPYTCGAIAIALSAFIIGGLFFYKKYIPPPTRAPQTVPERSLTPFENMNKTFKTKLMPTKPILIMIVLSGYLLSLIVGLEWAQFNYFPSFAHFSPLHITEKRAAVISTGLAIAFTIGRAIAIPVSHFLRPKQMIYGSLILLSIANVLFLFFASYSETFMWFANIVYGLGLSSVVASIYSMVEEQTAFNNLMGALFSFFGGLTSSVYPIILGYYIESKPLILIYVNILSAILSFLLMISIQLIIRKFIQKPTFNTLN
jgi:hypothetical protein